MKNSFAISLLLFLVPATSSAAVTVNEAVDRLSGVRPSIRAGNLLADAEVEELRAAAVPEGLEIEGGYLWGNKGDDKIEGSVTQSFDWPGVYAARRGAVKAAREGRLRMESARMVELRGKLRELLVEYVGARRQREAIAGTAAVLERLDSVTRRAYDGGEISILDVNKLTIARAEVSHSLHLATGRLDELKGSIDELAETDCSAVLAELEDAYPVMELPDAETYMRLAAENDPEMIANLTGREVESHNLKAEKRMLLPGFSAGYSFTREEGQNFNGLTIGLTLPSAASKRRAAAAELRLQAGASTSLGLEAARRAQYQTLAAGARHLSAEIERLAPVFEHHDNLRLLDKAYRAGQISMLELLTEIDYFYRARLSYIDDIAQYHLILARLNRYS